MSFDSSLHLRLVFFQASNEHAPGGAVTKVYHGHQVQARVHGRQSRILWSSTCGAPMRRPHARRTASLGWILQEAFGRAISGVLRLWCGPQLTFDLSRPRLEPVAGALGSVWASSGDRQRRTRRRRPTQPRCQRHRLPRCGLGACNGGGNSAEAEPVGLRRWKRKGWRQPAVLEA